MIPTLVQSPPGSVERSAHRRLSRVAPGVDGDRVRPEPFRQRALVHVRAELFGHPQTRLVGVEIGHAAGAVCPRGIDGVEADARRAAADDQDVRTRAPLERMRDGTPAVGHVVAHAGDGGGCELVGNRDEHVIRERHAYEVRQGAAPIAAEQPEAEHGALRDRQAVTGLAAQAAFARAARDLERHHRARPHLELGHVARVDDLRDELVPERDRPRDRRLAADDRVVEVAERDGQRAHDRVVRVAQHRVGRLLPLDASVLGHRQLPHGRHPRACR